jgi:hypothetical protein
MSSFYDLALRTTALVTTLTVCYGSVYVIARLGRHEESPADRERRERLWRGFDAAALHLERAPAPAGGSRRADE